MTTPSPAETERAVRMLLAHRIDAAIARNLVECPSEPAMQARRLGMRAALRIVLPSGDDRGDLVVYRAAHDGIPLGTYTTAAAARAHCEDMARRQVPEAAYDWLGDVTEPGDPWELCGEVGGRECTTGYTVTRLEVLSAYDPESEG